MEPSISHSVPSAARRLCTPGTSWPAGVSSSQTGRGRWCRAWPATWRCATSSSTSGPGGRTSPTVLSDSSAQTRDGVIAGQGENKARMSFSCERLVLHGSNAYPSWIMENI